jgi:Winged helix DNA-binding domain
MSASCGRRATVTLIQPTGGTRDHLAVDADQVLAFRLARSGLAVRGARGLAEAAACPASDFARDAALLALAARVDGVSREAYEQAVDTDDLVVAHIVRGAIHALAPGDLALYGRALIARDDDELGAQLGRQVQRLAAEKGFAPSEALEEVATATSEALVSGGALDKNALHEELRQRVRPDLMPWCRGCQSHHVAPMLWRYSTVKAGVRLDSERRYTSAKPGRAPAAREAVRRFLWFYGPATPGEFADWAGLAKPHAQRLWSEAAADLAEVRVGKGEAWLLSEDVGALESPPTAEGIRLLPPGDPYLQQPNRPLLAPDPELRKRLFRPVASPGAVVQDGRLTGLWRMKAKGRKAQLTVEPLGRIRRRELEEEARRVAELRGAGQAVVVLD